MPDPSLPRYVAPAPLGPGAAVAVLAPASPFAVDLLEQALEELRGAGYRVHLGRSLYRRRGYLAGTDAERAEDLMAALTAPEIAAIFCARGGYGSSRILAHVPWAGLRRTPPKIVLGFSDITFLHAALQRQAGWITFHGPNLGAAAERPGGIAAILATLGGNHPFQWPLAEDQVLRAGVASGPVCGGNLSCLVHLLATPWFPDLEGALLLLEDRGEACYRLDRMLTHLKMAGVFDRLGGVLFGPFTDCGPPEAIREMVQEHLRAFSFPVVWNLPFGHDGDNPILPLGSPLVLNTHERSLHAARIPFCSPQPLA